MLARSWTRELLYGAWAPLTTPCTKVQYAVKKEGVTALASLSLSRSRATYRLFRYIMFSYRRVASDPSCRH